MRIIGGLHKGRLIRPPGNLPIRPTTDLAKESLFNILNNRIDFEGLTVLDLFAGTGSISYEFASRGAEEVISVDLNKNCIDFIKKTTEFFKFKNLKVIRADAFKFVHNSYLKCDIVFADPPYDLENVDELPNLIFASKILKPEALFLLEHSSKFDFSKNKFFIERRNYGKVNFSFFRNNEKETSAN